MTTHSPQKSKETWQVDTWPHQEAPITCGRAQASGASPFPHSPGNALPHRTLVISSSSNCYIPVF